ncbi:MAG: hypothetical protein F9K46_01230 [Anaerolineae bacterium]|nr:MAG: hypothetical protein F9K46_01230 [Anaerolineae bacterium]
MSELRVYLFGTPRIEFQGITVKIERRKALALVAYLALSEQMQSREVIASLLWPDQDEGHARSALRSALRALTKVVDIEWIQADRMTIGLKREVVWVDVIAFQKLLTANSAHPHSSDSICKDCVDFYQQAATLYSDDFLIGFNLPDDLEFENWQLAQREWLRREYADVQRRLAHYYADLDQYEQAIRHAIQWLAVDTLHEPAHRHLMRLYAANGQRSEAFRQYRQCVEVLDSELATPPESETTRLFEAIQQGNPTLVSSTDSISAPISGVMPPLPSLLVGRDAALHAIKQRLGVGSPEARPITVIQGWPGVGKSTLVATLAHDLELSQHYPDGVLWASLGENPSIASEIGSWAEALRLNEPGQARTVEEISAQLTALLRDKRMLLIVEDVWQADHAQAFRVGGKNCPLVMTSRLNDVATALAPTATDIYRLPVLTEHAALELLAKFTPDTVANQLDEATQLVRDLEGLPLAIHVAGRLLQSEARLGWGVTELLADLREGASLLTAQAPSDMLGVKSDTSLTITALLKRSTDSLDALTRQYFAYLGLFVAKPATFDLPAMAVVWEVDDPKPIARLLVNRGLLEPVGGGRFQMHALLVLHARSLLDEVMS